jgi:2-phospho-L-lactate guanylyltransferase
MPLVVVPAKPLARAKLRLAPVLDPEERRTLCLAMLADVCAAVLPIGRVVVVASDTDAEAVARAFGAEVVRDPSPEAGLNQSLEAAIPQDPEGVLVISSDVAACTEEDARAMCGFEGVRLAPDADGSGTNALWRKPGDAIPLAFGSDSRQRHQSLAEERDVAFELVRRPGLALDIDLPAHLQVAWDAPIGENTRAALSAMGFPARPV